jgi:hypothetical protein
MTIWTRKGALLLAAGLLLTAATGGGAALATAHHSVLPFHVHADAHAGDSHNSDDPAGCDPAPMPSPAAAVP